jgi:HPt (histidine-containing phosphotransfer) domain-containing protein
MDDFLTKPVDPEGLRSMLQRWVHGPRPERPADAEASRAGVGAGVPRGVLDLERLDMLRDLDPESTAYLDRAIANFTSRVPESVGALHRAVARADAEALTQAAHRLKGSALNLGMPAVGHLAYELEMLGDAGRDDGAGDLLSALEEALGQAVARLREYQGSYRQPASR